MSRHGVLVKRRVRALAERFIAELSVKGGLTVRGQFERGNQQKVAIAKWLQRGCRLPSTSRPEGLTWPARLIHGLIRHLQRRGVPRGNLFRSGGTGDRL